MVFSDDDDFAGRGRFAPNGILHTLSLLLCRKISSDLIWKQSHAH